MVREGPRAWPLEREGTADPQTKALHRHTAMQPAAAGTMPAPSHCLQRQPCAGAGPASLPGAAAHRTDGWLRQLSPMAGRFSCRRSSLPPTMWLLTSTTAEGIVEKPSGQPGQCSAACGSGTPGQQTTEGLPRACHPARHSRHLTGIVGRRKALEADCCCRQQRVPLAVLAPAQHGGDQGGQGVHDEQRSRQVLQAPPPR